MTNAEAIEHLKNIIIFSFQDGYTAEAREALRMAINALEESRWIPCKERLPEDVEIGEEYPTVIFSTKDAVYCGFYEYYYGGNWWAEEDYIVNDVIAWKPLPEPYKENT